jgi:hypothetical protein
MHSGPQAFAFLQVVAGKVFCRFPGVVTLFIGIFVFIAGNTLAQSAFEMASKGVGSRNMSIPLWGKDHEVLAVLRVERFYMDYERRGFFRIALLPVATLEGVSIEVRDPQTITKSLDKLNQWLTPATSGRVELHQARLSIGTATNILEAGRMSLDTKGQWRLSEGVSFALGTNSLSAASGMFKLAGANTGELIIGKNPSMSIVSICNSIQPVSKQSIVQRN